MLRNALKSLEQEPGFNDEWDVHMPLTAGEARAQMQQMERDAAAMRANCDSEHRGWRQPSELANVGVVAQRPTRV